MGVWQGLGQRHSAGVRNSLRANALWQIQSFPCPRLVQADTSLCPRGAAAAAVQDNVAKNALTPENDYCHSRSAAMRSQQERKGGVWNWVGGNIITPAAIYCFPLNCPLIRQKRMARFDLSHIHVHIEKLANPLSMAWALSQDGAMTTCQAVLERTLMSCIFAYKKNILKSMYTYTQAKIKCLELCWRSGTTCPLSVHFFVLAYIFIC